MGPRVSDVYRLEALLALRGREEDDAKAALSRAEHAVAEAEAALADAEQGVSRGERALEQARAQGLSGVGRSGREVLTEAAFVERRRSELAAARAEVGRKREALDVARRARDTALGELAERKRALETVERHKAQWNEAQRKEADRREEIVLDELALRRGGGPRS